MSAIQWLMIFLLTFFVCVIVTALIAVFVGDRRYKEAMRLSGIRETEMDLMLYHQQREQKELNDKLMMVDKEYEDTLREIEIYEELLQEGNKDHVKHQALERKS